MERLAHRDLRNRSSEILKAVASGATYEITNNGEVVAILSPPDARLPLSIRPARRRGRFDQLPRVKRALRTEEALADLRSEQ